MPQFAYKARLESGEAEDGQVDAPSAEAAAMRLAHDGYFVTELRAVRVPSRMLRLRPIRRVPSRDDLAAATRQLGDLLVGGVPAPMALSILQGEVSHGGLKCALGAVRQRVKSGDSLSSAMARESRIFPPIYVSMVRSGETVGRLPEVLQNVAEHLEAEDEMRNRLKGALVYPVILMIVGLLTVIILITFVIPRLGELFADLGQALPLPTRILLALSDVVTSYGLVLLVGVVVTSLVLGQIRGRASSRRMVDRLRWHLPVLRKLVRTSETARFARTMTTLLESGLPLLAALEVGQQTAQNVLFVEAMSIVRREVSQGRPLSVGVKESTVFSLATAHVVAVGEDANDLVSAFRKIDRAQTREVKRTARYLTTIMEPVLVVGVGLIVGFIVFAMMLPVFQINLAGG